MTLFHATIWLQPGSERKLGQVKILQRDAAATVLPPLFEKLDSERYCSLGQDLDYYRTLGELGQELRDGVLSSLCDIVFDPTNAQWRNEHLGISSSLLRFSSAVQAAQEGRTALGLEGPAQNARRIKFVFRSKLTGAERAHEVPFAFDSAVDFPRRINVLIGRNGVGKTSLLGNLAICLSGTGFWRDGKFIPAEGLGEFEPQRPSVRTIVAVSFSPFDDFQRPDLPDAELPQVSYRYVGNRANGSEDRLLSPHELGQQFRKFIDICRTQAARIGNRTVKRYQLVLQQLERLFDPALALHLCDPDDAVFALSWKRMSSGQRIAAYTVGGLAASLDDGALVLFDEPETHLHPGLLSTLLAVIDAMLSQFAGNGIIATHHPFVLQQVTTDAVRVLVRDGDTPSTVSLRSQTFGGDLGELLQSALGLAEPERDWHDVLADFVSAVGGDRAAAQFQPPLELEARTYLRSLTEDNES